MIPASANYRIFSLAVILYRLRKEIEALQNEIKGYHAKLTVDAHLESSFKGLELVEENGQDYISDFDFDSGKLGIAGYGFRY